MGNSANKTQCILPDKGYRVISISRPDVALNIDLLTDYVISPDPKQIDCRKEHIQFQIYSILQEKIRSVKIPVHNRQIGFQLKLSIINSTILRITRIFPGSPLQKNKVQPGEFIVGVLQGNFSNIKSFAQLIKNITTIASKSHISIGICNQKGKTRLIQLSVIELKQWHVKGEGLLGCELAQGWIHKYKPSRSQNQLPQLIMTPYTAQKSSSLVQLSSKAQQVTKEAIDLQFGQNKIFGKFKCRTQQFKFRGNYKKQQIIDAAVICKCRPVSLQCQKCFTQKDGSFHFYNKKTSRIICMPYNFMMPLQTFN